MPHITQLPFADVAEKCTLQKHLDSVMKKVASDRLEQGRTAHRPAT
jgi:hypothetical protein